jgi:Domain of unknown function (DUF2382)
MVPTDALEAQPDGSFYLRRPRRDEGVRTDARRPAEPMEPVERDTPPAMESHEPVEPVATPVAVPRERVEPVAAPRAAEPPATPPGEQLFRRGYTVRHVPVERILDEPAVPRQEGDTMIYPVMEEVLVVQKKLMLREEIHVTPEQAPIETHRIELERDRRR